MRSALLGQGAMTAHVVDSTRCGTQPVLSTKHPVDPVYVFGSVLCAIDRSANAQAAWRHAALLASPGGVVETVSESQLFRHGKPALLHDCEGYDLLVVGAGVASYAAVLNAPIPTLIARWCPLGTQVTDTILVPIDDSPQSSHAVVLAGRLAADHGGTVTILPARPRDPSFQRAIAAGGRVLLRATGAAPRVLASQLAPEQSIPSAAASITASLVVLGCGSKEIDRRTAAQVVGSLGCSGLVVPDGRCSRSHRSSLPRSATGID
jgi:nucleotide-binding universal stress UspA family protein